jgi:hypothetical protein
MLITHIVSLGSNCRVTHNLRRYFDFCSAYPFDWWICPLRSATKFLREPDLAKLYAGAHLEPRWSRDGQQIESVSNNYYDILLHHEFPRAHPGYSVVTDFRDHAAAPMARQTYLLRKLFALDLAGNRILFVHNFSRQEINLDISDVTAFRDAVKLHFSKTDIDFLFINPPQEIEVQIAGATVLSFEDVGGKDWRGDHELWSRHLARAGVKFSNNEGTRFVERIPDRELAESVETAGAQ